MIINLPEHVSYIIGRLENAGYEAYAVGGCVRDSLLGREPQDWDITTSALPEETKALFSRTIDTGIEHGTVTVMMGRDGYEITTYRIDGKYSDSRHPDSVAFTRSLSEDLKRRDFTINAMAYCDNGLVDLFGGVSDLDAHIIRCVGNPSDRFREDALRILRAIRFSAQLGFSIDPDTAAAARELAPRLSNISAERIHAELHKLLLSPNPDRLNVLHSLGLDSIVFPELCSPAESKEVTRLIDLLTNAPMNAYIRWALLLLFTGSAEVVMHRLKFDNLSIHTVKELIRLSSRDITGLDANGMRHLINDAGRDNMELLFEFRRSYEPGTDFTAAYDLYRKIIASGDCTCIKELAVNGRDLISAGIPAGKPVGEMLDKLLARVLDEPGLNSRDCLLALAADPLLRETP